MRAIFHVTRLFASCAACLAVDAAVAGEWHQVAQGAWIVPDATLKSMMRDLERLIPNQRTPESEKPRHVREYTVQYQGVVRSGVRVVEINGHCESHGQSNTQLKTEWIQVLDGGSCHFNARYDTKLKKITSFGFNGLA